MTNPKLAARLVSLELADRDISIKHVEAFDLIAAACGYADRDKLKDVETLPVMKQANMRLLETVATRLARHDAARRKTIMDVTARTVAPVSAAEKMADFRDVPSVGEPVRAIKGGTGAIGVIPFMELQAKMTASVSKGATRGKHMPLYQPPAATEISTLISSIGGVGVFLPGYVIAITSNEENDPWTLFWNRERGWLTFDDATVFKDQASDLPRGLDMPNKATIRWLDMQNATFRAAVDAAIMEVDMDDLGLNEPDMPGEKALDYESVAAVIKTCRTYPRAMGPLEIAVRDGAQRASLYTASLSDDPETAGGQVVEWVNDVEQAFANDHVPTEGDMRGLLMDGSAAISGIRSWLPADDRLWAWLEVAGYPDLIAVSV